MVLTVFAADTPDGNIESTRNSEDRSAWQNLGIDADHSDLAKGSLRLRSGIDDRIIDKLCDAIRPLIALYPDATLYFSAGFDNHGDHLVCRKAAFRLLDEGAVDKIMLYEDIPYCWLQFVRKPYYKILLNNVKLDEASWARASRPGGLRMPAYLRSKIVPFPRGRKLFVAASLSRSIERLLQRFSGTNWLYAGQIKLISLSNEQMMLKKELLFRFKSQIPTLFGAYPNRLLNRFSKSFGTEVVIEISRLHPN